MSKSSARGQALAEFALVMPLLLILMLAIVDFGHMAAMHAAVVTASREAARYGSAIGVDGSGTPRYLHCAGIRDAARRVVGGLITLDPGDIEVRYDDGAGGTLTNTDGTPVGCQPGDAMPVDADISRYDRVVVRISHTYGAMAPGIQTLVGPITVVSTDRRTIVKP